MQRGKTIEAAARREAAEELGETLNDLQISGVYTNFFDHKSDHVVVFVCRDFMLTGRSQRIEIDRADFFPFDQLPPNLYAGHRRRIEAALADGHVPVAGVW